jgi:hypothetical protein
MRRCSRCASAHHLPDSFTFTEPDTMNQYAATIETDDDELHRETVEYDALSASEAQAYAMDDLQDNQRIVAIWQRIY